MSFKAKFIYRELFILIMLLQIFNTFIAQSQDITNLKIIFPYQKNEPVKLSYCHYSFVDSDFEVISDTVADAKGEIYLTIQTNEPKIYHVSSAHGIFKIYIYPNTSLSVSIYNERNIKYEGPNAKENEYLFRNGFFLEVFRLKSFPDSINIDETVGEIKDEYERQLRELSAFTSNSDFVSYATAEVMGDRFMKLLHLKGTFTNRKDTLNELKVDKYIDSFIKNDFLFFDECRSRRYNNLLKQSEELIEKYDKIISKENCSDKYNWINYMGLSKYIIKNTCCEYPKVFNLFYFRIVQAQLFKSHDIASLSNAKVELDRLLESEKYSSYINEVLITKYNQKEQSLLLKTPYYFKSQKPDSTFFDLSQTKGSFVVINFWATWCKPCIASMPDFVTAAKQNENPDITFIAVNIYDKRNSWIEFINENDMDNSVLNVRLDGLDSKKVFDNYYFDTVPQYFIIDKESNFLLVGANRFKSQVLPVIKNIK
jgi:thiol-disulfide isomerase/thioredoxin